MAVRTQSAHREFTARAVREQARMTEQPGPPQPPGQPGSGAPPTGGAPPWGPPPSPAGAPAPGARPPAPWAAPPTAVAAVGPAAGELAIKRSVVRCAVATVLSFGVYGFWWFYQYRRRINAELGKTDDAGLHTAGLLVPFLNYYLIYLLWNDISDARVRVGLSDIPAVAYVIGAIFVAPVFYAIVNAQLNEYWDRRTGGRATDAPWTLGETLATVVPPVLFGGFFLVILIIVGIATTTRPT
ncbi:MAG: hypothetical protein ACJ76S_10540 [Solirubrobacteraceae bacterium]